MSWWWIALIVIGLAFIIGTFLFYGKGFKRVYSFLLSLTAIIVLSPILIILTISGFLAFKGHPFFTQLRPGKNKRIFRILKFRTMKTAFDKNGKPLSDEKRLTAYGRFLRKTSFDELPQLFCILFGKMCFIGPRPLLIRDMVFMTDEENRRHNVSGGLTGLAQASGRNAIDWKEKLKLDVKYAEKITFLGDVKIIFGTVKTVLTGKGVNEDGQATAEDYGDYLLRKGLITKERYDEGMSTAKRIAEKA